jgi:phage terminase large subunit
MRGGRNYLICRKVGNSIKSTVFAEYKKLIYDYFLSKYVHINNTEMIFTTINGYKMYFKGLDDVEKVKSMTFDKGILTDIHIEEATEINEEDYNQLDLRLRGNYKGFVEGVKQEIKKQIIMSFNPIIQTHWIKKRFFDNQDDVVEVFKTTYKDNRFLTEQDTRKIEKLKNTDKYYYQVYALGNWGVLGNLVFNNWEVIDLSDIKDQFNTYYFGLDFGFTNDPTAMIKVAYKDGVIYVLDEHYEKGLHNDQIAKIYKEFGENNYVYCDSAEPKSINELLRYNIRALAVKKGKDSVKHGIQWIRQQKIKIGLTCRNFINEIQTYKYKETKDGNVLNEPLDMNNHLIDALRYALSNLMRAHRSSGLSVRDFGL